MHLAPHSLVGTVINNMESAESPLLAMEFQKLVLLCLLPYCALALRKMGRVVGGESIGLGQYPFVVAVGYMDPVTRNGELCTGSVLTPQWVLTAGHCVESPFLAQYIIIAGVTHVRQKGQRRRVQKIIKPDNYQHIQGQKMNLILRNDIALLQMDSPLVLNDFVKVTALTLSPPPYTGQQCEAVGFGRTTVPLEFLQMISQFHQGEISSEGNCMKSLLSGFITLTWIPEIWDSRSFHNKNLLACITPTVRTLTNELHGLKNLKVQCCIHKDSPIIPILSRINPMPHIHAYFFKIFSNLVLPSSPRPS